MEDSFIHDRASNTLPKYRFQLYNPETNEILTLRTAPIEWKEGTIEVKRDIQIGGVFTSFTVSSLTFIKEGRDFLNKIWIEKEFNGQCELIVSWFKTSTRTYQEMPTRFGLNFATAKPRVKVGKFAIGFLIDAQKSSILVKLENRKDKDVDITKTVSLGGFPIYQSDYNIKKDIVFQETNVRYNSIWVSNYQPLASYPIANNKDYNVFTELDMTFSANEFTEAQETEYQTGLTSKSQITNCFNSSLEAREISLYYHVQLVVVFAQTNIFKDKKVYAVIIEKINGGVVVGTPERILDCGDKVGLVEAKGTLNITLAVGDSIRIFIQTDPIGGIAANIFNTYFWISQKVVQYPEKELQGWPISNVFERILQHITDLQFPFYSDFFGTTDNEYNLLWDKYLAENQESFAHIMTGLNLRGAKYYDDNAPLPCSFEKLFKSANAIWSLGYSQEYIEGFERIRIEPYAWFFDNTEALNISDRISIYDIETEAMPELAYSQIKSGFKDYTYEKINGRGEFNTESQRSTVLNIDSVYDIVSDIRGDTMGITEKISQPLDTEDSEEDNELFIIKTQRTEDGLKWQNEKEENVQIVNNSSLFGDDTMNLYFTPLRMMLRHGNRIKGSIKDESSKIRFQVSDKLQTLETTGEGVILEGSFTIKENQDVVVEDLTSGIFKPIKHTVTCKFTFADFEAVMANKKGYITFSNDIKGYLLTLKKKNDDDKATLEIIEKI